MAILFDYNQTVLSAVHASKKFVDNITIDIMRNMVLNTLKSYIKKYRPKYGDDIIICCDSGNTWRKDVFPYYKARRKEGRDKSNIDWPHVWECMNTIRQELEEYFPYKVIKVDKTEGDDIIATLTKYITEERKVRKGLFETGEPIMIISSDYDFKQLQIMDNVDQFSPLVKKPVKENRPDLYLKKHIIRGDGGDDVPNFLSDDDVFMIEGKRQKPVQEKKLQVWLECESPEEFCTDDNLLRNYYRNKTMVDLLHCIPDELESAIIDEYNNAKVAPRSGLMTYFVKFRLKNLIGELQEF